MGANIMLQSLREGGGGGRGVNVGLCELNGDIVGITGSVQQQQQQQQQEQQQQQPAGVNFD